MTSILAALALVLPLKSVCAQKPTGRTGTLVLYRLTERTLREGTGDYISGTAMELIGFPKTDVFLKHVQVSSDTAQDDLSHTFYVLTTESKKTLAVEPMALIWQTDKGAGDEQYWFRTNLEGRLMKAACVSGAGKVHKDIHSPEIQERFQHEMDFWLQDAFRKK